MPPKAKITKEMVLNTVMEITRKTGFDAVNARSIASKLQCSTQPIFSCYENMDELKNEFLDFVYQYFEQYVANYCNLNNVISPLIYPLSYIDFAREETHLFKLLFINDMNLDMQEPKDFYKEIGNEERAKQFSEMIGVELERAKIIFLDLFLYSHGIAVLTATKKLALDTKNAENMLRNILSAFIKQEKEQKHV